MTDQTIVGGEERARRTGFALETLDLLINAWVARKPVSDEEGRRALAALEALRPLTFAAEASGIGVLREALEHADEWLTNLRHTRDCAWREDDHCDCGLTKLVRHIDEALAASISSREAE